MIAIEPSEKNLDTAKQRAAEEGITNILFIRGSFEKPNCEQHVGAVMSSFVFHKIPHSERQKSIDNIYTLLKPTGKFIFCDPLMFFDPQIDPKAFNEVYRYLLPRTLPPSIYKKYIEPYLSEDQDYVFTWEDMKKYTPKDNQFYTLVEIENFMQNSGFRIDRVIELAPFFGIIEAKKPAE